MLATYSFPPQIIQSTQAISKQFFLLLMGIVSDLGLKSAQLFIQEWIYIFI